MTASPSPAPRTPSPSPAPRTSSPSPAPRTSSPTSAGVAPEPSLELRSPGLIRAYGAFAVGCVGLGLVSGVAWRAIVTIPNYRLDSTSHALISERGLAAIFSIDAWYACAGLICGLVIGVVTWLFFRRRGWHAVLVAAGGSLLAALVCGLLGWLLGPGPFQARLAAAEPGDLIPVDFQLHAYSAIAFWPFGAMLPLLLLAALSPDPEDPGRRRRRRSAADLGDGGAQ